MAFNGVFWDSSAGQSLDPQFLLAKRRFRFITPVVLPFDKLPHPLLRLVVVQNLAVLAHFEAVEEDRHCLADNPRMLEEQLVTAVAAVVGAQVAGDEGVRNQEMAFRTSMPSFIWVYGRRVYGGSNQTAPSSGTTMATPCCDSS